MTRSPIALLLAAAAVAASSRVELTAAQPCESLASLELPDTAITLAASMPAGAFVPVKPLTGPGIPPATYDRRPAFCRVAVRKSAPDRAWAGFAKPPPSLTPIRPIASW